MKETIAGLTDNEILMCKRWEVVVKRKWEISTTDLEYCYNLVFSDRMTNNCPDCLRRYASAVNNYYTRIVDKYKEYKENKNKPVEKVEEEVKTPVVTKKKQVVKKQVVRKKKVVKASGGTSKKAPRTTTKKDDNINTI